MAVIGNISIGIRADSKGLKKGLDSGMGSLRKFTNAVGSIGGMLGAAGIAVGVAKLVDGFKDMAAASVANIVNTTKLADRIGTTTKALSGLQYAAKMALGTDDVQGFTDALSDMQEKIGDVTLEEGGATDILQQLGLDANTMANQDAEANFLQISEAISGMQSQAEQLHVADTLFGGEGQKMLPLLKKGKAGIKEMQDEAERFGLAFNKAEAGPLLQANHAIAQMQAQMQGFTNQIVIQTAPVVTALIDELQKFGSTGVDVSSTVSTSFQWVADAMGLLGDIADVIVDAFYFAQSGVTKTLAWMADAIWALFAAVDWLSANVLQTKLDMADTVAAISEDLHKLSSEQWDGAMDSFMAKTPSEQFKQFTDGVIEGTKKAKSALEELPNSMDGATASMMKLTKSVQDLEASLKEQIATFGKSSTEAEIYKLTLAGATDEQLSNVKKLAEEMKGLERFQEFQDQAKDVAESLKTPQQKYEDEVDKLLTLMNNDLITYDQFTRASQNARNDIFGDSQGPRFAAISDFGSANARSDIMRHRFGGGESDPQKEAVNVAKDTLDKMSESVKWLKEIAQNSGIEEVISFPV